MAANKLGEAIDATSNWTSPTVKRILSYDWSLIIVPTGLSKKYRLTLEVSDNETDWAVYKLDDTLIDQTENTLIVDSLLPAEYFRVQYNADGNSSGTLDFWFNVKKKE